MAGERDLPRLLGSLRPRLAAGRYVVTSVPAHAVPAGLRPLLLGQDDILGGPHWAALVVDCAEGLLTVFGCVWALAVAQRRLDRPFPLLPALARCAYAAFVVQGFVLIGLAVALRPVPVPAGAKALRWPCSASSSRSGSGGCWSRGCRHWPACSDVRHGAEVP